MIRYVFDFKTKAFDHKRHYDEYTTLNKEIELATSSCGVNDSRITEIGRSLSELAKSAPLVTQRIWRSQEDLSNEIAKLENELAACVSDSSQIDEVKCQGSSQ